MLDILSELNLGTAVDTS